MKKNDTKRFFLLTVGIIMAWCTCGVLKADNTYMVIGSDVEGLDGIYTQNGTSNNKPAYSNPAGFNLRYKDCTNKWVILDNSSCPYYSTYTDGNVPTTEGWHSGGKSQAYFTRSVIVLTENSLGYDKKFFVESLANDGSFNDTIRIALYAEGNNFTGHKGDDYVAAQKVTISKLPSGLTMKVIKTSDTTLIAILSGKAYTHEYANSINNLSITFNDIAFAQRNAANVNGYNCNNINVLFQDRLFVSGADNYWVNDTFNLYGLYNGKPMYVSSNKYAIIYKGCKWGSQWAIIRFYTTRNSNCSVYATQIVSNTIPLGSGKWFSDRGRGSDEIIVTSGNAVYLSNFKETDANDGSVDSVIINYAFPKGDNKFSGADGDDFIAGGKVSVTNVPIGLTASIIRLDSVNLKFKLIGNATNHTSAYSVSNIKLTLNSSAFAKGSAAVGNIIHDNIQVNFKVDSFYVKGAISDALVNGWYSPYGTYNGRQAYTNGSRWLWYRGCTTRWKITSNKESGCAIYSAIKENNEAAPLTGWYKGNRGGEGNNLEPLSFVTKNSIFFDKKKFDESKTEAGALDSINIKYLDFSKDNKFSGNNGDDFVTSGKVTVSNVPAGLTAAVIRMDSVTLKFKFLGKATNNIFTDAISNLAITFNNSAFTSGKASEVVGIKDTFKVVYLVDSFFVTGAISNDAVNGWYKPNGSFNNKPTYTNGYYWIWNKICSGGAKWKINTTVNGGCPNYSTSKDDEILPLTGWNKGGHGNGKTEALSFYLPNSIFVENKEFVESKNVAGTIKDSANIYFLAPFDGNTFSGANGEDFVTTGKISLAKVPVGLTATVTRMDSVTLKLKFSGSATNNAFSNSVNDISFTLNNTAFAKGNTTNIANLKTDSLKVAFLPDSFIVWGAVSNPSANGYYTMEGLLNSKPYYTNGYYWIGYRNCNNRTNASKWVMTYSFSSLRQGGGCPYYSTTLDSSIAPVAGWFLGGQGGQSKTEPIVILYPNSIAFDKKIITESATAGVIKDTIIIYYLPTEGNAFSGANGDNFASSGKAIVKNLPAGLTAEIIRTSDTSLVAHFTGKALYNKINDAISNLSIELTSSAFTKGNSTVKGCKITDINVVYNNKLMVMGGDAAVNGWYVIDGTYNQHVQFKKYGGSYYIRYKGCANYTKWAINQGGCATSKNSVNSLMPSLTGWTNGYYLMLENSLGYSKSKFNANYSGILNKDSIVVTLYRPDTAMLSGTNGDDFIADGKLSVSKLPSGLTIKAIRTSDTTVTLYFNGQILPATYTVGLTFNSTAFSKIVFTDISFASINVTVTSAKTWTVASSGADFTSVADAVNSSDVEDGDMLKVSDGTYEINNLAIGKDLTIKGNSPNRTTFKSTIDRMFYTPFNSYPAKVKAITFEDISFNYSTSNNGVIELYYAKANFNNCEFNYNQRVIYVNHGRLNVNNCTFANNSTYSNGAAIYIYGDNNDTTNISNTTFYGNKASGSGGAIYSYNDVFSAMNCTFVADTTYTSGSAIYRIGNSNISVTNCLFAKNNNSSIAGSAYNINYCLFDNAQTISTGANNIINSASVNVDVLTANGGTTYTCALLTGSSAINSGTNVNAPVKDQRGVAIANGTRDIGAFEYNTALQIVMSDTLLTAQNMLLGDTLIYHYSFDAINVNLNESLVISATGGYMVSSFEDHNYSNSTTLLPDDNKTISANLYVRYIAKNVGIANGSISHTITDTTVMLNIKGLVQALPTSVNQTILLTEGTNYKFKNVDFTFASLSGHSLDSYIIDATESNGDLEYDGKDVKEGTKISDANKLVFKPFEGEVGSRYADFSFKVLDNKGLVSKASYLVTININDAPKLTVPASNTINEDSALIFSNAGIEIEDKVGAVSLVITSLETAGDLEYDGTNVVVGTECADLSKLVFKPAANASGTPYATIGIKAVDSYGLESAGATITINVNSVNDAPVCASTTVTTNEDANLTFSASSIVFSDAEGTCELLIASLETAGDLEYDGTDVAVGTKLADLSKLVFKLDANANGTPYATFGVKAVDAQGLESAVATVTINVTPVNDVPVLAGTITNMSIEAKKAFSFEVPNSLFADIDGETLAYSASLEKNAALPSWLSFNATTRTLSGTPDKAATYVVVITAKDSSAASVSTQFTLTVKPYVSVGSISENNIEMYPNPAIDFVNVNVDESLLPVMVTIKDINGKLLSSDKYSSTSNSIAVSTLSQGVYFVEITNKNGETIIKKMVKE